MTASNYQPARFRSLLISFILFSSLFVGIVTLTPAVSADSGRVTGNEEITATGLLPGFTAMLGLVAMLGAALVIRTKPE